MLWLDGQDLRKRPWSERKARLLALLTDAPAAAKRVVGYVEPLYGDGAAILRQACALGLEGILSKRVDAPYRGARSDAWCRTKCERSDTFTIVGFGVDEHRRLKSLHLARAVDGELTYAGAVEQGIRPSDVAELEKRLLPLAIKRPMVKVPVRKAGVTWVTPQVLVEISFPNAGADGAMRHPRYKGLREDLVVA